MIVDVGVLFPCSFLTSDNMHQSRQSCADVTPPASLPSKLRSPVTIVKPAGAAAAFMRRLLPITISIFLLGQLYVIYILLSLPAKLPEDSAFTPHVSSWTKRREGESPLSDMACKCPPVSPSQHRGLSLADDSLDFTNTPISALRPPPFYLPGVTEGLPPLVSVVIPYYNAASTIRETVLSVLIQSLQWIEIIIVDDVSTAPDTSAVLTQIRHMDKRIRVVRNEVNSGLAATRNAGAAVAEGEFLFFLDADDLIEPTALEVSAWYIRCRPSQSFVGGWTVGFGAQEYLWRRGFDDPTVFVRENVVTATKMVRREHFGEVGGFDSTLRHGNEDWEFWLRMASAGRWGTTLPQPLDWYRRKPRDQSKAEWAAWTESGMTEFLAAMRTRYPRLFVDSLFPTVAPRAAFNTSKLWNPLQKGRAPRLLFVSVPRPGNRERREVLLRLVQCGWQLSVCLPAQDVSLGAEDLTPDVFIVSNFLEMPNQFAPFIAYLGQSRSVDVVVAHKTYRAALIDPMRRANLTMIDEGDFVTEWTCTKRRERQTVAP